MKALLPTITLNRVFAARQDDERVLKALRIVVKASYEETPVVPNLCPQEDV